MTLRASLSVLVVFALVGCGASRETDRPGFGDCLAAWNGQSNSDVRALVARKFVPAGYAKAGIQLSLTLGVPIGGPDPNPIGCRVVFFRTDRWVAYRADREGDHFRFRGLPGGRESDQRGLWPTKGGLGLKNATIVDAARLALRG